MKRRNFLSWVGLGTLFELVLGFFAPSIAPENKQTRKDGFMVVGTTKELNAKGVILNRRYKKPVFVVRHPSKKNLIALNPSCSHKGCLCVWKGGGKVLDCPCHGSQFGVDGTVLRGPAQSSLARFSIKEEKGIILVRI